MSYAKHTPGPWTHEPKLREGHMPGVVNVAMHGGSFGIAHVLGLGPEAMANGALIAAAPDLISAAEDLIALWEPDGGCGAIASVYARLQAAIARAKGQA